MPGLHLFLQLAKSYFISLVYMCKCQYQCSRYFTPKCMCDFATEIQTDKRISSCIVTVENSSKQPCNPKDYFLESQKFSKEMNREVMQK